MRGSEPAEIAFQPAGIVSSADGFGAAGNRGWSIAMNDPPVYSDTPSPYTGPNLVAARERVLFPAIFLLVTAVLNIFLAIVLVLVGMFYRTLPPEQAEKL